MIYQSHRMKWVLLAFSLASAGIAWFLATDAAAYLTYSPQSYTDYYWSRRAGLIVHVSSGSVALTVGLVQLFLGLTGRTYRLHRMLGRLYLLAVMCGVSASFYMAATIPAGAPVYTSGLVGLGVAWLTSTVMGYLCVIRGDIAGHRAWMIRSYVVTFGFVTFRVIAKLIAASNLMTAEDASSPAAWLCWVVPLAVLEISSRRWGWGAAPAVVSSLRSDTL